MVFVINTAFSSVPINVGNLVDSKGVFFVKRDSVKGFCRSDCLFRRFIFHESKALNVSGILYLVVLIIPFGLVVIA